MTNHRWSVSGDEVLCEHGCDTYQLLLSKDMNPLQFASATIDQQEMRYRWLSTLHWTTWTVGTHQAVQQITTWRSTTSFSPNISWNSENWLSGHCYAIGFSVWIGNRTSSLMHSSTSRMCGLSPALLCIYQWLFSQTPLQHSLNSMMISLLLEKLWYCLVN